MVVSLLQILNSFPLPGLWENYFFLVLLVAFRVLFYAITARPLDETEEQEREEAKLSQLSRRFWKQSAEEPQSSSHLYRSIGSFPLYLLVLIFFGWLGLLFVLIVHYLRVKGYLRFLDTLSDRLPHSLRVVSSFTLITYFVLIIHYLPEGALAVLRQIFPIPGTEQLPFAMWASLVVLAFLILAGKQRENFKEDTVRVLFGFMIFLALLGIDFLLWYVAFAALRPVIDLVWRKVKQEPQFESYARASASHTADRRRKEKRREAEEDEEEEEEEREDEAEARAEDEGQEEEREERREKEKKKTEREEEKNEEEEEALDALNSGNVAKAQHPFWAFIIMLINDLFDYVGGWIPIAGDVIDVVSAFALVWAYGGLSMRSIILAFTPTAIELFPGGDLIPTYFIFWLIDFMWKKKGAGVKKHRALKFKYAAIAIVVLVLVILIPPMFNLSFAQAFGLSRGITIPDTGIAVVEGKNAIPGISDIISYFKRQFRSITHPGYIAEVEDDANRNIGLQFSARELGSKIFYTYQPGTVSFDLSGEFLDMRTCLLNKEDPKCIIKTECAVKDYGQTLVEPRELSIADVSGTRKRVDCQFTPLEAGVKEVTAKVRFDFETRSSQQFFAASTDALNLARLNGENLLDQYGYSVQNPKRTPGPVDIYWDFSDLQPIPIPQIKEDMNALIPFTVRIEEGSANAKIVEVKTLDLYVPEGFAVEKCGFPFAVQKSTRKANESGVIIYELASSVGDLAIEDFLEVSCWLKTTKDAKDLLFNTPAPSWFFLRADIVSRNEIEERVVIRAQSPYQDDEIKKEFLTVSSLDICPTDVQSCDYPSQEWCNVDPCNRNCVYYFGGADTGYYAAAGVVSPALAPAAITVAGASAAWNYFATGCGECPAAGSASCDVYANKEYCSLDPCRLGCAWEESTDTCFGVEIGQNFDWPTDTVEVFGCKYNRVQLSPYDRTVKAIASGKIIEGRKESVAVDHGNGYVSHYANLKGNRRAKGNVQKGETVGFAGRDTLFYITKDGTEINIFEHYDTQKVKPLSVLLNTGVKDCPAAQYAQRDSGAGVAADNSGVSS